MGRAVCPSSTIGFTDSKMRLILSLIETTENLSLVETHANLHIHILSILHARIWRH